MKRTVLLSTAFSVLLAGTAFAAEPMLGAKLGTTIDEISATLSGSGYEMTKFEREGNRIEVYAVKENIWHGFYVDSTTGELIKVEMAARGGPSPLPGKSDADIRASLKAEGYDVTKYERERRQIEVYAMKDNRHWELKVDPRTGNILSVEAEN